MFLIATVYHRGHRLLEYPINGAFFDDDVREAFREFRRSFPMMSVLNTALVLKAA